MSMGMEIWPCDIRPWSYDLELGNLVDALVPKILMPVWLTCACGLLMWGRYAWLWNFCPVTFDLGPMTLAHRRMYRVGFVVCKGNAIRLETRRIGDHPSVFLFSTWLGVLYQISDLCACGYGSQIQ